MYKVVLHAYCGMRVPIDRGDKDLCRSTARMIIKRHRRQGGRVNILEAGRRWELETPETACMVSDDDGILEIIPGPVEDEDAE
jgi:hypothetical protein